MKIAVTLYKSNTLANGEHPLMVRVTHNKTRKYLSLGISCLPSLWNSEKNHPKKNHPDKKRIESIIAKKIAQYHTKHLEMIAQDKPFSAEALIKAVENTRTFTQFFPFLDELIDRLVKSGKINTSLNYRKVKSTLIQFVSKQFPSTGNEQLLFTDINQQFLLKYETHLRERGLVDNTLAAYFRVIRATLNKAVKENLLKEDYYPFRDFKVAKFNTATKKRAMSKEELKKLATLSIAPGSALYNAQQFFLFSYYGRGINFRDMAFLKWGDIVEDRVFYERAKTGKRMEFKLSAPAQAIVDHYRPQGAHDNEDYIFPVLNKGDHRTPIEINSRVHTVSYHFNKNLKKLASLAGININLTKSVARHTYATVLKMSGVSTSKISEAMGHANPKITQIYLKSFGLEVIDEANEHLL